MNLKQVIELIKTNIRKVELNVQGTERSKP